MEILDLRADSDKHPVILCVYSKLSEEKAYYIQVERSLISVSLSLSKIDYCMCMWRPMQFNNKI